MPAFQRSLFWPEIASRQAAILAGDKLFSTAAGVASIQEDILGWQREPPKELALADGRYLLYWGAPPNPAAAACYQHMLPSRLPLAPAGASLAVPPPAERTILPILPLPDSFSCHRMNQVGSPAILWPVFGRKPLV